MLHTAIPQCPHPASGEGNVTLLNRTFKPKGWQGTQLQIGF